MKKRSKQILTLFILGLVLILLAPYVPDFCFRVLLAANFHDFGTGFCVFRPVYSRLGCRYCRSCSFGDDFSG